MRPSRSAAILPLHQVVAGEAGRRQVLRPVLHPLDRLAGEDGADDGADVAGVDRDLVAEAAADVRRDHLDLVLGQAGHERVQRAVRVRRLGRAPQAQLPGDRVHVRHRAARLQRAGVDALERDVLRDEDDVRVGEDRVGLRLVARLPVEDVVVGLALLVVADDRRVGVERACAGRRARAAARTRRRSARARRAPRSGPRRPRRRPPGPGSAPCPWRARPGCRRRAWASRRAPAPSRSLPVMTARTFGCCSAADVSTETMRACASGLRSIAPCSIPGSCTSST